MIFRTLLLVSSISFFKVSAQKATYSFEYHLGVAYNIPAPLSVYQEDEEALHLNAYFDSESLQIPLYWNFRFARFKNNKSWEFEAIHHKLYMIKNPNEIQNFSISHGYNIMSILRSQKVTLFKKQGFIFRYGLGTVLAHPESTIRGKKLNEQNGIFGSGYYISGPVLNLGFAKRFYFSKRYFFNTEFKLYPSVSKVPVFNGHAVFWNVPVAFIFGIGIDYINPRRLIIK